MITLSTAASVLLLALAIYIISKERTASDVSLAFSILLLALIDTMDQLVLHSSYEPALMKRVVMFLESLLPVSFTYFSITYSRKKTARSIPPLLWGLMGAMALIPVSVLLFPSGSYFYAPDLQTEKILFLGNVGYWFYMGLMTSLLIALMNLEATFLSTRGLDRWKIKFEVVGLICILAFFLIYFSQGLLYRTINMNLVPVRSGVMIIAALLIGYSRIFRESNIKVAVSRHIVYRSISLMIVGLYLLSLGLVGGGMRYFGVAFSRDLTIFIAIISGTAILLILFSEQLRRKAKVLINRHFYANKHDYRGEWLKLTERLASCRTLADIQNAVFSTYKEAFGLRGTALYILNEHGEHYSHAANQGMEDCPPELRVSPGMFSYFTERFRVFDRCSQEYLPTAEEASFIERTDARFIVPLIDNGAVEGLIILGPQLVEEELTYEDYDLIKTFAKHAMLTLSNFKLTEQLAEAREMAAMAKISSFVIHDLKNHAYSLSLLLENATEYMEEPEFQKDMLETIRNTVIRMKNLIQKLKVIPEKQALETAEVDLHRIIVDALDEVARGQTSTRFLYQGKSVLSMADSEEIRKVILNLLINAVDATNGKGEVRIETGSDGERVYVRMRDNGCGMEEAFINNHLFKPFRTTKDKGLGVGLYQCRQIVEAHGGRIEVDSEVGKGAVFTVYLPASGEV